MLDPEILIQCQRNNSQAQRTLFESNFDQFMGICMRYSKSKDQAKEMLTYAFSNLIHDLSDYSRTEHDFEEWSKARVINHAIDYLKASKNEYYVASTVRVTDSRAQNTDLFNDITEESLSEPDGMEILKALQSLPPSFRATYNLCVIEGFDLKKTSDYLEISEDTVRFNLEKASFQLEQTIKQYQKGYQ